MTGGGPWQAWVATGLTAASILLYVAIVAGEGIAEGDLLSIIGIVASLVVAAVCTAGAALLRRRQTSIVLLVIALIPLVAWGFLGAWTIGGLFLLSGAFVVAALWTVVRDRPEHDRA